MKIEFLKKTNIEGTFYYTAINGAMVIGSFKSSALEARKIYDRIIELEGKTEKTEVLEKKVFDTED